MLELIIIRLLLHGGVEFPADFTLTICTAPVAVVDNLPVHDLSI